MIKIWFKKILIITLELTVVVGALWYVGQRKGINSPSKIVPALEQAIQDTTQKSDQPQFPDLKNPVARTFSWTYKGIKYSLPETLNQSVYDFYSNQPKTYSYVGTLQPGWEDSYYAMFLKQNENDQTIADLAGNLQDLGKKHNLSDDQIVDLTMAFVQSISYDDARAKEILSKAGSATMQYPYETLYRQLGVCSDKSLLAYSLLRQMGYGVALLAYEQDNHMAIGIQCPKDFSTYSSGYCYAETTSTGNKVGIIPSFDAGSNKTVELGSFDPNKDQQIKLQQLGQVTIFDALQGKQYSGIIATKKIENQIQQLGVKINTLLSQLQTEKKSINDQQQTLEDMRKKMDSYKSSKNLDKYNSLVPKYNDLIGQYQKDVKKFNSDVKLYNQTVGEYNLLIKQ